MLGTRRQVVNRVLRDMAATGAIHVQYGRISILDREKLDRMAPKPSEPLRGPLASKCRLQGPCSCASSCGKASAALRSFAKRLPCSTLPFKKL